MRKGTKKDKALVVALLVDSFRANKSVNSLISAGHQRHQRLQAMIAYCFDLCMCFGEVFVSTDENACALLIYPERKTNSPYSIWLGLKMVFNAIGLKNLKKAFRREQQIFSKHPKNSATCHLWFIGVNSAHQGKGMGSKLLGQVITHCERQQKTICLETSTLINLPWYEKFGFKVYQKLNFGYTLYLLKRDFLT